MNSDEELPFEPAPGSTADVDYMLWEQYLEACKETKTEASLRDYLVWLEDNDVSTDS